MRLSLAAALIAASVSSGAAFAPSSRWGVSKTAVFSTVEAEDIDVSPVVESAVEIEADMEELPEIPAGIVPLTADEINARLSAQLDKLREKDQTSQQLNKEVGYYVGVLRAIRWQL